MSEWSDLDRTVSVVRDTELDAFASAVDNDRFFLHNDRSGSLVSRVLGVVDHWEGMIWRYRQE